LEVFEELETLLRRLYYGWEGAKQFEGTGSRLSRMVEEFCWPPKKVAEELDKCFKTFQDSYDEMLVSGPTEVWTLCPHHLLPCKFKVYAGYIPKGEVLGLSKFSRVADILARRPIIQEQYSRELANTLWTRLQPKGVGVFVIGEHGCMRARGVKQDAPIYTAVLEGAIKDRPEVRAEFYSIVNERRRG